jgi:hypothetical protein
LHYPWLKNVVPPSMDSAHEGMLDWLVQNTEDGSEIFAKINEVLALIDFLHVSLVIRCKIASACASDCASNIVAGSVWAASILACVVD